MPLLSSLVSLLSLFLPLLFLSSSHSRSRKRVSLSLLSVQSTLSDRQNNPPGPGGLTSVLISSPLPEPQLILFIQGIDQLLEFTSGVNVVGPVSTAKKDTQLFATSSTGNAFGIEILSGGGKMMLGLPFGAANIVAVNSQLYLMVKHWSLSLCRWQKQRLSRMDRIETLLLSFSEDPESLFWQSDRFSTFWSVRYFLATLRAASLN